MMPKASSQKFILTYLWKNLTSIKWVKQSLKKAVAVEQSDSLQHQDPVEMLSSGNVKNTYDKTGFLKSVST